MPQFAVQFMVRYTREVNSPERMREFSDGLHRFITGEEGLQCLWGSQGGMATVYGVIYREDCDSSVCTDDRDRIANWISQQRINCTAKFGDPQPLDSCDLQREPMSLVLDVRNLTEEDLEAGRAYCKSLRDRINAIGDSWPESGDDV